MKLKEPIVNNALCFSNPKKYVNMEHNNLSNMSNDPNKLIYIVGLGHSGTTLLNLMLGSNSQTFGTGEAFKYFHQRKNLFLKGMGCTCQKDIEECEFWSNVERNIFSDPTLTEKEYIKEFTEYVIKFTKKGQVIVDSSKNLSFLDELKNIKNIDLQVLFIIKDVRAWCYSIINKALKLNRFNKFKHNYFWLFRCWFVSNKKIENFLLENKITFKTITYEELCLYPRETLIELCDFVGVDFEEAMTKPNRIEQHFINGNRMRFSDSSIIEVNYDDSWKKIWKWKNASKVLRRIMRYNDKIQSKRHHDN